jgi:hypothetical protein
LLQRLEELSDWPRLAIYGKDFFARTGDLKALRTLAEALYQTKGFEELRDLLAQHPDLVAQSQFLGSVYAWALFKLGSLRNSLVELNKLRQVRDDANDRILYQNISIASGEWSSLAAFVEQEWERRDQRTALEMLRAGQLAQHVGSLPKWSSRIRSCQGH